MTIWLAVWNWYSANAKLINPLGTFFGAIGAFATAATLAWAAIRQARTAARQAEIASQRHEAQTEADRERRITENFTKAVEQLGSDKLESRIGGIFILERISRESSRDYWMIMELLCSFLRERGRWTKSRLSTPPDNLVAGGKRPYVERDLAADIAAVLGVIHRRNVEDREREAALNLRLDLRGVDLVGAYLPGIHLKRAIFSDVMLRDYPSWAHLETAYLRCAHLEGAFLGGVRLERANLESAHLEGAVLLHAHLEEAYLLDAHFEGADLGGAHLKGANLHLTHLEGANLTNARLEGVDLSSAYLDGANITSARGDTKTKLPNGMLRPDHWDE
jgi:uncharacterized protein YjbI with pentapeptide repeats